METTTNSSNWNWVRDLILSAVDEMIGLQSILSQSCLGRILRDCDPVAIIWALNQTGLDLNPAATFSELYGQDNFSLLRFSVSYI